MATSDTAEVVPLSSEELDALRQRVRAAIVRRFPQADADDVAQEVLLKVHTSPQLIERAHALDSHTGYFVRMAFNTYLMMLRTQQRREKREAKSFFRSVPTPGFDAESYDGTDVLDVLDCAPLSELQRVYVRQVLEDQRSIAEIAAATDTSERAVRGVLERAAAVLSVYVRD